MGTAMYKTRTKAAGSPVSRMAIAAALAAGLIAPLAAIAASANHHDATPVSYGVGVSGYQLDVDQSKSQVLELPTPYTDLMIADPKIADVMPLSNHSVYVVGKSMGATALTIYGPGKRLIAAVNVVVSPDIDSFKARLHEILPNEKDISARAANQSLVLSGTVASPAALNQILQLAETYAPGKIVNMMGVEGTQQVMLSVRFVEMERSTLKNLSIQINSLGTQPYNPGYAVSTGQAIANAFGGAAMTFFTPDGYFNVAVDALETKGLTKTLAEPTLVTMSGETASFLAGGEIPIPTAQTASTGGIGAVTPAITLTYQQFGISLAFTPTILSDGMINLVVKPEVSSIDAAFGYTGGGITVPGLKVRRANTTVELRDGKSFTIAGLLGDTYQNNINQFPWLGDIPILGPMFRNTNYQRDQDELVIIVTPHLVTARRGPVALPTDHFVPPSDFELFLFGMMAGKPGSIRPEDRVLMSQDPTKGGVEGPYGHVLY